MVVFLYQKQCTSEADTNEVHICYEKTIWSFDSKGKLLIPIIRFVVPDLNRFIYNDKSKLDNFVEGLDADVYGLFHRKYCNMEGKTFGMI